MITLDDNNSNPIYEQVYDKFTELISSNILKVDEKLPSIRELAQILKINPNTIQKSYRLLEKNKYIYTLAGKGNFVAKKDQYEQSHITSIKLKLSENIRSLKISGLSNEKIIEIIKSIIEEDNL